MAAPLRYKEAAEYLNVSEAWLRNNVKLIPHIKLHKGRSGKVLFKVEDLDAFLDSRRQEASA